MIVRLLGKYVFRSFHDVRQPNVYPKAFRDRSIILETAKPSQCCALIWFCQLRRDTVFGEFHDFILRAALYGN